jgi:protein gp37
MYYLDKTRSGKDGSQIYRTGSGFNYPLQRDRRGNYKVKSGEEIRVCMTSDFFLKEADEWRGEAWDIIRTRSDVIFFLLTKRPQRVAECLPKDWGDGWENVFFNVTCENQRRADERIPILLDLPFKHKGIMCAPFIGEVHIEQYLADGQIEQVIAGGENYDGSRICNFDWVKILHNECKAHDVTFCFIETGTRFVKDGKLYNIPSKTVQSEMAFKSGMSFKGREMSFKLTPAQTDLFGLDYTYKPTFRRRCDTCGSRIICNGCSNCGKCGE